MKTDHAGVHFPPPFAYAGAVALGAWLSMRWPWPVGGGLLRVLAAYALLAIGVGTIISAFTSFWSRGTTVLPIKPSSTLVIAGPYRLTRNPMYVALAIVTAGAGLWADSWWILILLLPAVLIVDRFVIRKEEAYLVRRFGADYQAYMRRVRRWV